eukprot:4610484-Amphidinium_carterae.1
MTLNIDVAEGCAFSTTLNRNSRLTAPDRSLFEPLMISSSGTQSLSSERPGLRPLARACEDCLATCCPWRLRSFSASRTK